MGSTFGKYGVGGTNPGKWPGAPDEQMLDFADAAVGTARGNPDSAPEVKAVEGSHNKAV